MSYSIKELAGLVVRANLANSAALDVLLHRIEAERDKLRAESEALSECLQASALIVRAIPVFDEELQHDLQQISARVIRAVARTAQADESRAEAAPHEAEAKTIQTLNEMSLGGMLIELGIVREQDVDAALSLMDGTNKRLGEALVELGMATPEDLDSALELQKILGRSTPRPGDTSAPAPAPNALGDALLGEIMLRSDRIDESQLDRALSLQRKRGIRIGEALVELGAATWTDVTEAIREQVAHRRSNPDAKQAG